MTNIMTKTLRSSFLILAFSLFVNNASAQSCGVPPTCESLGYAQTATECGTSLRALRCPFDTSKMYCTEVCEVGSILNQDKSCSKKAITGKTPIGIVFDTNKRLAIALERSPGRPLVFRGDNTDIPNLDNCSSEPLFCGTDGKANTAAIIDYGKNKNISYPVAEYCSSYTTTGTQAGDWFLPSYVDLKNIYNVNNYINASLKLLNKTPLYLDANYWSSTEHSAEKLWIFGNKGTNYILGKMSTGINGIPTFTIPVINF